MPRRSKIDLLPAAQRDAIREFLEERGFGAYRETAAAVEKKFGLRLSRSALTRYDNKFEHRLEIFRLATAQARAICAAHPDGDARAIGEATVRFAQRRIFDALIKVTEAEIGTPDLPSLLKLAAEMERVRLAQDRRAQSLEDRLARAARIIETSARPAAPGAPVAAPGADRQTIEQLRAVLCGAA